MSSSVSSMRVWLTHRVSCKLSWLSRAGNPSRVASRAARAEQKVYNKQNLIQILQSKFTPQKIMNRIYWLEILITSKKFFLRVTDFDNQTLKKLFRKMKTFLWTNFCFHKFSMKKTFLWKKFLWKKIIKNLIFFVW